jgi:hypothetical protein
VILEQFVRDLDAVFSRAPPLRAPLVVFRGLRRRAGPAPPGTWYVSTTMRRDVARHFADERAPIVQEVVVPRGARPLAMCVLSRYTAEAELLLPRRARGSYALKTTTSPSSETRCGFAVPHPK